MFSIITDYWFFWFWFIPLLILYFYYDRKRNVSNLSINEMGLILEIGFICLFVFLIQKYIFTDNLFFIIAIPFFIFVWAIAIHFLLSDRDIYVIETTMTGQKFYDLENKQIVIANNTSHRLLVMDTSVYNSKMHIGELDNRLWKGTNRLKFTDKYDDNTGIFYHPQIDILHNVNFYAFKGLWIKLREDVPKLIEENTKLTWLINYNVLDRIQTMRNNFPEMIIGIEKQIEHKPFKLYDDLEELYKQISKEKQIETLNKEAKPIEKADKIKDFAENENE